MLSVAFMDYCWTSADPLDAFTNEFGLSPSSISSAPQSGALEPFASPAEALEALFQNPGFTLREPAPATATAISDQASFPPSVFVFSGSPSTCGLTKSRSGEVQTPTLFDSSSGEQTSNVSDDTKLSQDKEDYSVSTLSRPIAKTSITLGAHELVLHGQCPVGALNSLRPVEPIKGMIRKHKKYLTVGY